MSFTDFQKDKHAQGEVSDPTQVLKSAPISRGGSSDVMSTEQSASDVLAGAFDPARLHPLAGLGDKLDYLILEDNQINTTPGADTALPSRGWSDDLCYGTGTTYLAGTELFLTHLWHKDAADTVWFPFSRSWDRRPLGCPRGSASATCRFQSPTTN